MMETGRDNCSVQRWRIIWGMPSLGQKVDGLSYLSRSKSSWGEITGGDEQEKRALSLKLGIRSQLLCWKILNKWHAKPSAFSSSVLYLKPFSSTMHRAAFLIFNKGRMQTKRDREFISASRRLEFLDMLVNLTIYIAVLQRTIGSSRSGESLSRFSKSLIICRGKLHNTFFFNF